MVVFSCTEMPNQTPLDSTRIAIFSVDMNQAINSNLFESDLDTISIILDLIDEFKMTDEDQNNVFSCTIPDLIFGRTYNYMYSINGNPENLNGLRSFTVYDEGNMISDVYGELMAFRHERFWHPVDTLRDKNYLNDDRMLVNTFRIIFNSTFGSNYELLDEKLFWSTNKKPYSFNDVTQIIQEKNL